MLLVITGVGLVLWFGAYVVYPAWCRAGTEDDEARGSLPGDELVPRSRNGYTLAIDIVAPARDVWPWLAQMGQGRGGFYTHEWIESLLGAKIHNADRIHPEWQYIAPGDRIRLTPDPYLGKPGQQLVVVRADTQEDLCLFQQLPNGSPGSWAFVLRPRRGGRTRLLFRRRSGEPSLFDRVAMPGYYFMDRGMLRGIKRRAEIEHAIRTRLGDNVSGQWPRPRTS